MLALLKVPEMYGAVTALAPSGRSCGMACATAAAPLEAPAHLTGFQFGVSPKHAAAAAAFAVPTLVVASNLSGCSRRRPPPSASAPGRRAPRRAGVASDCVAR